jgi:hypothetical protein
MLKPRKHAQAFTKEEWQRLIEVAPQDLKYKIQIVIQTAEAIERADKVLGGRSVFPDPDFGDW